MVAEPVDVRVLASGAIETPMAGVLVRAYEADEVTLVASSTTNSLGVAAFLLPAPALYVLRFFKYGAHFTQPVSISPLSDVATPGATQNLFDVYGQPRAVPASQDPRFCKAGGLFRDPTGKPLSGLQLSFVPGFLPVLVDGAAVLGDTVTVRTDQDGYAEVELLRCAIYKVMLSQPAQQFLVEREVKVPDSGGTNLPDLVLPRVSRVSLLESGPYQVPVGQTLELTPTIVTTAGVPVEAPGEVVWSSSDPSSLSVSLQGSKLLLRGIQSGTFELRLERVGTPNLSIPDLPIQGQPFTVTIP